MQVLSGNHRLHLRIHGGITHMLNKITEFHTELDFHRLKSEICVQQPDIFQESVISLLCHDFIIIIYWRNILT